MLWGQKIFKEYHGNGALKSEASFSWGRRDGITRQYYENGALMIEAGFRSDKPHGKFMEYYEDGTLMAEECYKDGELLLQKRFDKKGKLDGVARSYYGNGQIKVEANFKGGKAEGISMKYHDNGALMAEEHYRNGVLLSQKGYDKKGALEGFVREYFSSGPLRTETDFKEGMHREYHRSGSLKVDARFKDKKPHGLVKEYYEDGTIAAEDEYESGRLAGSRRYDTSGNLVSSTGKLDRSGIESPAPEVKEIVQEAPQKEEPPAAGEKTVQEHYLSGALKAEKRYLNGKLNGLTKEHYESGELMAEVYYKDGEMESQTRYDKTGRFIYKFMRPGASPS